MANAVSRLKNTDSLAQWSEKINNLMDSVDVFVSTVGAFASNDPDPADLLVYDTGWKNKRLIAGDVVFDGSYSNDTQFKFKLDPIAVSSKTEITSVDTANDFLLIWDATDSALKKIKPSNISSQVGGSNTQVQFNDNGALGGDSGLTYNKTTDILTIGGGLVVDTSTLVVDGSNNRVGVVNASPAYPLDVTGDINTSGTFRLSGAILFNSATSLNSTVVSSSLTSVGTLSGLTVSGAATFQTSISALNLTVTNTITGSISGNAGSASAVPWAGITSKPTTLSGFGITDAVATSGNQTIGGTKTFSSTISGSISGNAGTVTNGVYTTGSYADPAFITSLAGSKISGNISGTASNISSFTINQNLGTSNSVQFSSLGVGTAASGTTGEIRATNNVTAYFSDRRLKTNFESIDNALEKIKKISGVFFTQNNLAETFGYSDYSKQVGVIAQEIQSVLPEAVTAAPFDISEDGTSKSGENYLTVRYEKIVPLLIEGIKELSNQIEELKNASTK
jgi:hypothetical protein